MTGSLSFFYDGMLDFTNLFVQSLVADVQHRSIWLYSPDDMSCILASIMGKQLI